MHQDIFQTKIHDQFYKNEINFSKAHWVHSDGHISTKRSIGKLLNRWFVTRAIFRSICGIQLKKTINNLKKESSQYAASDEKQLNFNSTCEFLVHFINQLNLKQKTQYINELNNLKFKIPEPKLSKEKEKEIRDFIQNLPAGIDEQAFQKQIQEVVKLVEPKDQEAAVALIMKEIPPTLVDKAFKTPVLPADLSQREKMIKVRNLNTEQTQHILQNEDLHTDLSVGLTELAKSDTKKADVIVQQIKKANLQGKELSPELKSACEQIEKQRKHVHFQHPIANEMGNLNKLSPNEASTRLRTQLATGKNDDERYEMLEVIFEQIDPKLAPNLFVKLDYSYPSPGDSSASYGFSSNGSKLQGLLENPKAFEAVLSSPETYPTLIEELSLIIEKDPEKANQAIELIQKKEVLQNFTKAAQQPLEIRNLAKVIAYASPEKSKAVLESLEPQDKRYPHLAAELSMAKVPNAHDEVTKAFYEGDSDQDSIFQSILSRPLGQAHVENLFDTPYMQMTCDKLKSNFKLQEKARFILDLADELKSRFCPLSTQDAKKFSAFSLHLFKAFTQQASFLNDSRYERIVSDEYIKGFDLATDELAKMVDYVFDADQKKILEEEIKKEKELDLNIFLLLLLLRLNPDNAAFVMDKVALHHDFCLLFLHLNDTTAQDEAVLKRMLKLQNEPKDLEYFRKMFLAFQPIATRNEWSKFLGM